MLQRAPRGTDAVAVVPLRAEWFDRVHACTHPGLEQKLFLRVPIGVAVNNRAKAPTITQAVIGVFSDSDVRKV